jgi:hypothetical protein
MWPGKLFYGLGVQGVKVLILLSALFMPSVAPASLQGFGATELTLSDSAPSWPSSLSPGKVMTMFHIVSEKCISTYIAKFCRSEECDPLKICHFGLYVILS